MIAIAIRVPSCYESFWLDELHSAWCVWDSFGEVFPRADIGHQTPFYFAGLWVWKQLVGTSEVALRFSSVMAVAASCAVLVWGVSRWSKSVAAGTATGLVMALETNSLFFGTELTGLSDTVLDQADAWLKIPMMGFTESFNISVSAAIILHYLSLELRRSSLNWQLDESQRDELLLDWLRKSIKHLRGKSPEGLDDLFMES